MLLIIFIIMIKICYQNVHRLSWYNKGGGGEGVRKGGSETVWQSSCASHAPDCTVLYDSTCMSMLNPSLLGHSALWVASSHFSKRRANNGNKGCLKQMSFSSQLPSYTPSTSLPANFTRMRNYAAAGVAVT